LLSAAAAVEDGARAGPLRERIGEGARRNGVSSPGLCGDARTCASLDERAEAGNALDGAAEVEAACGAEAAEEKATPRPRFKQRTWGTFRGERRLPIVETEEPLRAFWQARFYDFNVYSKGKRTEKLNYMHANPVIRGLVKHPRDWAWSSWAFYFGGAAGLVAIDVEE
jgi:hypothetical protein